MPLLGLLTGNSLAVPLDYAKFARGGPPTIWLGMRAVIQRVSSASVVVADETVGAIDRGLLVLFGVTHSDSEVEARWLAEKVARLRIFNDAAGKMNLDVAEVGGAILVVSQFTLYGECQKGRRPSFIDAARPEQAEPLYEAFVNALKGVGIRTATGRFGATMHVHLVNEGPVTVIIDSPVKGTST